MMHSKQLTVVWHVDDLKISYVETTVVDNFIELLTSVFGKASPLSISRGKVHDYLGLTLDFNNSGQLVIDMSAYAKMVVAAPPDDMRGRAPNPGANHLFQINEVNPTKLDVRMADVFHSLTMQHCYLAQRGHPDILLAVAFVKRILL
jgi:hypothetical protein